MAQKTGALIFDETADRYDIRFDLKADPAAFMEGIEDMARELVKTYPFLSDDKAQMFKPERETLGSCPRCGSPVYEGKKNYYCLV